MCSSRSGGCFSSAAGREFHFEDAFMKAFFRKNFKKSALVCCALACVAACNFLPTAFASAAVSTTVDGAKVYGAYLMGANGGVGVDSAEVTFNIADFPKTNSTSGLASYKSTVSTAYSLRNTSDTETTLTLAVPNSDRADYDTDDCPSYVTCVQDEEELAGVTRYYLEVADNLYTTLDTYISDSFYSDAFYSENLAATLYKLEYDGAQGDIVCELEFEGESDPSLCRFIGETYFELEGVKDVEQYALSSDDIYICVLGDKSAFAPGITLKTYTVSYSNITWQSGSGACYVERMEESVEANVKLTETETTTLKDVVLSYRPDDCAVSETDWYNGIVRTLTDDFHCGNSYDLSADESEFTPVEFFSVTVGANETSNVTFTSPIYPEIDYGYTPYLYYYHYGGANYGSWSYFSGDVTAKIDTPYYICGSSDKFEEGDDGVYVTTFSRNGSLTFNMSAAEEPVYTASSSSSDSSSSTSDSISVLLIVLVMAVLISSVGSITIGGMIVSVGGSIYLVVVLIKDHKGKF